MKKTIIGITVLALAAVASWNLSYHYYSKKMFKSMSPQYIAFINRLMQDDEIRNMTPQQWKAVVKNAAQAAKYDAKPHDEVILGMAYMAYRHIMLSTTQGLDVANSNRLSVIKAFFNLYPSKFWGLSPNMADEMRKGIQKNPELFPGISIEQSAPPLPPAPPTGPSEGAR